MNTTVFTAACSDYDKNRIADAVARIFDAQGGAQAFLKQGNRVTIKPNLLMAREPSAATTTHPALVEAVAKLFVEAGAQVTIADSPGGPYNELAMNRVYQSCGMEQVAQATGAVLNRDYSSHRIQTPTGRAMDIIAPIYQADVIINLAKMKTHMLTYFTGAVKNLYGVVPGLTKAAYHSQHPGRQDFAQLLVDLCQWVQPAFSIIDGVEGMDGKGPSGGRVRQGGLLIGAVNPYAADLYAMGHCGLNPQFSPVYVLGRQRGLAPEGPEALQVQGDSIPKLAQPFLPGMRPRHNHNFIRYMPKALRPALEQLLVPYPKFAPSCIGCGACVRACPGKALEVIEGKARLDKAKCIKCYCCHELCPVKAIDV